MDFYGSYKSDTASIIALNADSSFSVHSVISEIFSGCGYFQNKTVDDYIHRLLSDSLGLQKSTHELTPNYVHRVWVTNPSMPSDPFEIYGNGFLDSIKVGFGPKWKHIFWTNHPESLEKIIALLANNGIECEIHNISDSIHHNRWLALVTKLISDRKFVSAADLIRLYALYKYGGMYCDMSVAFKLNCDDINIFFEYCFVYSAEHFFQNSFMLMPANNVICSKIEMMVEDPYLFPPYVFGAFRPWMELHIYAGPIITALALRYLTTSRIGVVIFNHNTIVNSSKASWYSKHGRKEGLYGNVIVLDAPESFLDKDKWLQRRGDILA